MVIILKNIPAKATKQDVNDFVIRAVKGGLLDKKGKVTNISLLILRNLRTHVISNHSLVSIEPDNIGQRVIKKLNRKVLLDKPVVVAEYKKRNAKNELRLKHNSHKVIIERRVCERRGQYEVLAE